MKGKRVPSVVLEQALRAAGGIVSSAAKKANMSRAAFARRMKAEPKLREVRDEIVEEMLDLAESKLVGLIRRSNPAAIFFFLKTKGRARGYVERQEVDMANVEPIRFYIPKKEPLPENDELATIPLVDDAGKVVGTMGDEKPDPEAPPDGNVH